MSEMSMDYSEEDGRVIKYKPQKYVSIEQRNKNLSNIIRELKEEIEKLNEKAKRDNYEILILKQQIKTRTKKNTELTEELNSCKHENLQISQQMKIQEQSSQELIKLKIAEINAKDSEMFELKEEISMLKQKIELMNEKFLSQRNLINQMRNLDKQTKMTKSKTLKSGQKLEELPMYSDSMSLQVDRIKDMDEMMEKSFSWDIKNVHDKREMGMPLKSDYFYVRLNKYKFQLALVSYGTAMNIRLLVHASLSDLNLKWPLHCEVMIKIVNSSFPLEYKKIKEDRMFIKPEPNSFQTSSPFVFSYHDLFQSHLLARDSFTMECYIVIK